MKIIKRVIYEGNYLDVLIAEELPGKAFISYFLNGEQLEDWESIDPIQQGLLSVLREGVCLKLNLTLWSY